MTSTSVMFLGCAGLKSSKEIYKIRCTVIHQQSIFESSNRHFQEGKRLFLLQDDKAPPHQTRKMKIYSTPMVLLCFHNWQAVISYAVEHICLFVKISQNDDSRGSPKTEAKIVVASTENSYFIDKLFLPLQSHIKEVLTMSVHPRKC